MEDERAVPVVPVVPPETALTSFELTAHDPSRHPSQTGPPGIV